MNRSYPTVHASHWSIPHTRGDEPNLRRSDCVALLRIPHTRGDEPSGDVFELKYLVVFPTHVGMNRQEAPTLTPLIRIPHTRGDEPHPISISDGCLAYSPHTWG